MLQQAYGENCLSRTQCHEWYRRLKSGRTSIEDDPKSGRPSTSIEDDHVDEVLAVIRQNRRLTVREVAEEVGISKSSCHLILTEKLKMRRVAAKFVRRLLTDAQKGNRVSQSVSQELFDRSNADEKFLKNVIKVMKLGCTVTTLKQKSIRRSGWENCRHDQKKSTSESLKCEGDVDRFFF
jgi:transcriptional regulator with XRE-family HTH domain